MSSRNRKRRREVRQLEVKEIETFGPAPRSKSKASLIEDYILWGDEKGRDAMFDLFPLPGNVRPNTRV